jgi:hypothetical protein
MALCQALQQDNSFKWKMEKFQGVLGIINKMFDFLFLLYIHMLVDLSGLGLLIDEIKDIVNIKI